MKFKYNWPFILLGFLAVVVVIAWQVSISIAKDREAQKNRLFLVNSDDPFLGSPQAKVKIVEFADFQCPFCQQQAPILKAVMAEYGEQVQLIYRDFPIVSHYYAQKAAEAGKCANEQGKFWQLHDLIFANQQGLNDVKKIALTSGVDMLKFNQCLDSGKYTAKVQIDKKAGEQAGVRGTPTLFVNGEIINGLISKEALIKIIKKYL